MTVAVSKALEEGATRGRLRLDRQHVRVGGRLLRPRRHPPGGGAARGRDRPRQAGPGADLRRPGDRVQGVFDDALGLVRELVERRPIALLNSINPYRLEGQKTAAFEVVEQLGGAPDWLALPVGNGGNITAYWKGFSEMGVAPRMLAGQAAGAAPLITGLPVRDPQTVATAIRIGNPARLGQALAAVSESNGGIRAIDDDGILAAYRMLAQEEGVFCEPASAASVAALLEAAADGLVEPGLDGRLRAHRPRAQGSGHRRAGGRGDRPLPAGRRAPGGAGAARRSRSVPDRLTVAAPASSANLGPGSTAWRSRSSCGTRSC